MSDTYLSSVVLLLHGNGGDDGTVFCNSAPTVWRLPTRYGTPVTKTATKKYGSASIYFDGSGDSLAYDSHADFALGSGDFTIEAWVNADASQAQSYPACMGSGFTWTTDTWELFISRTGATYVSVWCYNHSSSGPLVAGTTDIRGDGWVHVAVTRSGNTFRLFVNGTQEGGDVTFSGNFTHATSKTVRLGTGDGAAGNHYKGYLDDVRITKGVARYTSNFTPDAAEFYDEAVVGPGITQVARIALATANAPSISQVARVTLALANTPQISQVARVALVESAAPDITQVARLVVARYNMAQLAATTDDITFYGHLQSHKDVSMAWTTDDIEVASHLQTHKDVSMAWTTDGIEIAIDSHKGRRISLGFETDSILLDYDLRTRKDAVMAWTTESIDPLFNMRTTPHCHLDSTTESISVDFDVHKGRRISLGFATDTIGLDFDTHKGRRISLGFATDGIETYVGLHKGRRVSLDFTTDDSAFSSRIQTTKHVSMAWTTDDITTFIHAGPPPIPRSTALQDTYDLNVGFPESAAVSDTYALNAYVEASQHIVCDQYALETYSVALAGASDVYALNAYAKLTPRISDVYGLNAYIGGKQRVSDEYSLNVFVERVRHVSDQYALHARIETGHALSDQYALDARQIVQLALSDLYELAVYAASTRRLQDLYDLLTYQPGIRSLSDAYALAARQLCSRGIQDQSALAVFVPQSAFLTGSYALRVFEAFKHRLGDTYALNAFSAQSQSRFVTDTYALAAYAVRRLGIQDVYDLATLQPASLALQDTYALLANVIAELLADTWVVNLKTGVVSRYSAFNFVGYAEFGGVLYGLAADGLYRIETDNSEVIGSVKTGRLQFGTSAQKKVSQIYLGIEDGYDISVTASADGGSEYAYTANQYHGTQALHTARADLGMGLKGRYFQFEVSGEGLELESIEARASALKLKRRV